MEFLTLFASLMWGVLCYKMAESRNRNAIIGGALGVLFGIFAVIGYAIIGDKKIEKNEN